jgi:hypothetical protein
MATGKHKETLPSTQVCDVSRVGSGLILDLINGGFKGSDNIPWILRPKDGGSSYNDVTPYENGDVRLNMFPGFSVCQFTCVGACTDRLGTNTAVNFDIFLWETRTQLGHFRHTSV